MKILHILYSGVGGVYNVVDSLVSQNDKLIQNDVLYVGPKINLDAKKHKKKLKNNFIYIKTIRFFSQFYFFQILNKILVFKPKIIILHNFQLIPCLLAKLFLDLKLIYVDHTPLPNKNFKDEIIIFLSRYFVNHYIVLNLDNFNYFKNKFFINTKKISIISNGVNVNLKRRFKYSFNKLRIGMAGRMNNLKLHKIIIDTIESLNHKKVNIDCYFVGEGENQENLKEIVKRKKLKNIFFEGTLDQGKLIEWYSKLSLYVQATRGEGSSISILQSMSLGTPIIASNVSGIKNLKLPYKNYTLFNNSKNDLEKKILKFFKLPSKQKKKIIISQKNFVHKNHSNKIMYNKYKKIYLKIFSFK